MKKGLISNLIKNNVLQALEKCVGPSTYRSDHPVGSTALAAASVPAGSWGCEMGERHWGVCSKALGTHPVWAD